jgi:hypothetical protein
MLYWNQLKSFHVLIGTQFKILVIAMIAQFSGCLTFNITPTVDGSVDAMSGETINIVFGPIKQQHESEPKTVIGPLRGFSQVVRLVHLFLRTSFDNCVV